MVGAQGGSSTLAVRLKVVWGRRMVVTALLILVAVAAGLSARAQQPRTTAAQEGFVPVKDLPPSQQEQVPAAPLLMTAYAVAWGAILIYVWSIWQRLNRVQREIADVSRRVEAGARR